MKANTKISNKETKAVTVTKNISAFTTKQVTLKMLRRFIHPHTKAVNNAD